MLKSKCPRCDHDNADGAAACAQCGMTLGAARHAPVLHGNRWVPEADELAVFFGVSELKGIFTKRLHVPATTRAYILQDNKATEVPQGDYELEGFFQRLNNLLRDQHAEILITRQAAFAVVFGFDDLHSAEFLKLTASFTVSIRIEQITAFAQHFMTMPGTITRTHLHDLLVPMVRQVTAEFIGAQSMHEMAANAALRPQLDERLQAMLKMRFAQYGLAVVQVDTLELRHDKWDENREKLGSLWLIADTKRVQLEYAKQFDELYDAAEWQRITREENQMRLKYRRGEIAQDEGEQMQTLRAREIELYGRIVEANTRKQAIDRGAADTLKELEHGLAKNAGQRETADLEWPQMRALAQIKMRTELEITQLESKENVLLAQQRVGHQLHQLKIEHQAEEAERLENATLRRTELARCHQMQTEAAQRERQLRDGEHQSHMLMAQLAVESKKREARRLHDWEDELQLQRRRALLRADARQDDDGEVDITAIREKVAAMRRSGAEAEAVSQQEKLLRTIESKGVYDRQQLALQQQGALDALEIDEKRLHLRQQEEEVQWQRQLQQQDHARDTRAAQWQTEHNQMLAHQAHETVLARLALERITTIGGLSDTAKVALADTPNAALLADILKTQVQLGMSAEQIAAAKHSYTEQEARQLVAQRLQEERSTQEHQADKERQHLMEMLKLQNTAHAHALSSQMQLGVGVARGQPLGATIGGATGDHGVVKHCFRGHPNQAVSRFCVECGAPLV
jgi:hypothetical protein